MNKEEGTGQMGTGETWRQPILARLGSCEDWAVWGQLEAEL